LRSAIARVFEARPETASLVSDSVPVSRLIGIHEMIFSSTQSWRPVLSRACASSLPVMHMNVVTVSRNPEWALPAMTDKKEEDFELCRFVYCPFIVRMMFK
jgi:hypothetical protein